MPDPTTGILDDFNRANEDPLSDGGNWGLDFSSTSPLRLISNRAAGRPAPTITADSYWAASSFNADQEAFATMAVQPSEHMRGIWVAARIQQPSDTLKTWDGYTALLARLRGGTPATTGFIDELTGGSRLLPALHVGAGSDAVGLYVVTNDAHTLIGQAPVLAVAGSRLWLHCSGTTITVYHDGGTGFEEVIQVVDGTYNVAGFIGLRIRGDTARADDFGGGSI